MRSCDRHVWRLSGSGSVPAGRSKFPALAPQNPIGRPRDGIRSQSPALIDSSIHVAAVAVPALAGRACGPKLWRPGKGRFAGKPPLREYSTKWNWAGRRATHPNARALDIAAARLANAKHICYDAGPG